MSKFNAASAPANVPVYATAVAYPAEYVPAGSAGFPIEAVAAHGGHGAAAMRGQSISHVEAVAAHGGHGAAAMRGQSISHVEVNEPRIRDFLRSHGWPVGLQQTFITNVHKCPMRFFICDDSGSMGEADGHLPHAPASAPACTRWEELTDMLRFMLNAAVASGARTEFRLLNGCEPVRVGADLDPDNVGFRTLMQVFSESPRGGTPLCKHIREVIASIREMEGELRANRQKAVVTICTDGVSSDGDLIQAMKPLESLPCFVVINICTDDDTIVEYWNNVDRMIEKMDCDVLDDYQSEAKEVYAVNPWLSYGLPLHRMRQFGLPSREFDVLDSNLLTAGQMRSLVAALLGGRPDEYPDPIQNFKDFAGAVSHRMQEAPLQKDPMRNLREHPWVNMSTLSTKYGPKSSCSIA